jgi:hypothetical protein
MRFEKWCVAVAAMMLAGCQTWGPTWSEVSGARYTRIDPDRAPAILIAVGDESVGSVTPFRVAPGTYRIVLQSPVHNRFRGSEMDITLKVEPCRRYYLNAQFDNPVSPGWKPVIDYVESIPGCTV